MEGTRDELEKKYPLTSYQKDIWLQHYLYPGETLHTIGGYLIMEGSLCIQALLEAVKEVTLNNEAMKTVIGVKDNIPYQQFAELTDLTIDYIDYSTEKDAVRKCMEAIDKSYAIPFDLYGNLLFEYKIFKIKDQLHYSFAKFHHIIVDGFSVSVFYNQLSEAYNRIIEKREPAGEKSLYSDFIREHFEYMDSDRYKEDAVFWKSRLSGLPETGLFEQNKVVSDADRTREADVLTIPRKLYDEMTGYAIGAGSSTFHFILGILYVYFDKFLPNTVSVAGVPILNRKGKYKNTMGLFVNMVPLSLKIDRAGTFEELLLNIRRSLLVSYRHIEYPYGDIVNAAFDKKERKRLFDISLSYEKYDYSDRFKNLKVSSVPMNHKYHKKPLSVFVREYTGQEDVKIEFFYGTDWFDDNFDTKRMISNFEYLIYQILEDTSKSIADLEIQMPEEKNYLIELLNQTELRFPDQKNIQSVFREMAEKIPDFIAAADEKRSITYCELDRESDLLAAVLIDKGVKSDTVIGLFMDRTVDLVTGILGILKAGGAYLPLDLNAPSKRLNYMLKESQAPFVVTKESLGAFGELELPAVFLERLAEYEPTEKWNASGRSGIKNFIAANVAAEPCHLAYVIYTSGTSGKPKGVMIEHRNVLNLVNALDENIYRSYDASLRFSLISPYFFDASVKQIFPSLLLGHSLYIPSEDTRLNGGKLLNFLKENRIDIADGTPTHMDIILHTLEASGDLPDIKRFVLGGESLTYRLVKDLKKYGKQNPAVSNIYGPTECCDVAALYHVEEEGEGIVPIGIPIANTRVFILNSRLELVPKGVAGELYISGKGVGRGYLNNSDLTKEKYIQNPFLKDEVMYRTGDLARWNKKGLIEFLGRADGQVKIRGHRIELEEINSRLVNVRGIEKAAAIVRTEDNEPYICAYLTGNDSISNEDIIRELSKELPDYMIPSYFVRIGALPMTSSGKLDKRALPDPKIDNIPEENDDICTYSEAEKKIRMMFQDILSLKSINKKDNFFHMGGHSIKAMYLSGEIEKEFHVKIPLRDIFAHPTVEGLGSLIEHGEREAFVPIPAAVKKEFYPLSYPQKKMYVMNRIKDCNITYNIPSVYRVKGELDKQKLLRVLKKLIARHEVLRTSFILKDGEPVQRISGQVSFRLQTFGPDKKDVKDVLEEFIRPFDLAEAPLMRVGVLEKDRLHCFLMFDFHHIISDGVSAEIFMNELISLYNGKEPAELSVQYKDFVEWEERRKTISEKTMHKEYWKKQYGPNIPILNLPADYQRPAYQKYEGDRILFELDKTSARKLSRLADRTGISKFTVMFAQYYVLLSKYTGQEDIIIGTPMAGRTHPDLQNMMGMFINTIGIRSFPRSTITFIAFLEEVKEKVLHVYEHQDYNLEEILSELNEKRDMSRNPLFDTVFTLNTVINKKLEADHMVLETCHLDFPVSKFDLTLTGKEYEGTFYFEIEFSTALYKKETMERFAGHFQQVVKETLDTPDAKLSEIGMMTPEEKSQMLQTIACGRYTRTDHKTILTLFEEQVRQSPERTALVRLNRILSYKELDERAAFMARRILAQKHEDRESSKIAGLLFRNSMELIIGMIACLKAGISFMPIDPEYPADRIIYMLKDSGAFAVITVKELYVPFKEHMDDFSKELFLFADDIVCSDIKLLESQKNLNGAERPEVNDNAYIIYTSGSTGRPKGVMVGQDAFINFCLWFRDYYKITEEDRTTKYAGVAFDASLCEIFPYLISGASVHIIEEELKYNLEKLNQYYENQHISTSFLPTQICEQFMKIDNKSLRILLTGGEKLKQYYKRDYLLINNYGPTETTVVAAAHTVCEMEDNIPIGRPVDNTEIYIMGRDSSLLPVGVPGELCIGGKGLANGYLNQPELTKERFVLNPFKKGEKMYRTGDLARYLPDGNIEYLGRMDNQVKIRGYRIELGEIEQKIKEVPGIEDAAVAVKEIRGTKWIAAYLVTKDDDLIKGMKDILNKALPGYMIPSYFISIPAIPLTPNGKVDTGILPLPATEETGICRQPGNEKEEIIAEIWRELLHTDKVGIHDDFFEIGGNSILMMNVLSQLNLKGLQVSAKYFMENPTIFKLAETAVEAAKDGEHTEAAEGKLPLLPNRSLLDRRNKRSNVNHWNLCLLFEVSHVPAAEDLEKVFQFLYRHHDGLRLRLKRGERGWEQEIRPSGEHLSVDRIDMSHIPPEHRKEEIERKIIWYQEHITLDADPMRAALFYFGEQQPGRIMVIMHHALIDGYSAIVFLEDFVQLYRQMSERKELKLPHKTTSLKRWSEYLKDYTKTAEVEEDARYWMDIPDVIEDIPLDHPEEKSNNFFKYERIYREIIFSREESEKINRTLIEHNLQFNSFMLTAIAAALKSWAGHGNFLIDYALNGRYPIDESIDLSRTLGWLAYLVPIYLDVCGSDPLLSVKNVHKKLEELPKGGLSYGCLRYLSENRGLKMQMERIPPPAVTYNYFKIDQNEEERQYTDDPVIQFAEESTGNNEGDYISRDRLLDFVVGGEQAGLFLRIHYSCNIHDENTIRRLFSSIREELLHILEYL